MTVSCTVQAFHGAGATDRRRLIVSICGWLGGVTSSHPGGAGQCRSRRPVFGRQVRARLLTARRCPAARRGGPDAVPALTSWTARSVTVRRGGRSTRRNAIERGEPSSNLPLVESRARLRRSSCRWVENARAGAAPRWPRCRDDPTAQRLFRSLTSSSNPMTLIEAACIVPVRPPSTSLARSLGHVLNG